ncbi:MAG: HEAT repeat domain-containing protein, partial [bacterium]|nr:HEAT repeat domain-containing protein [bacterium]
RGESRGSAATALGQIGDSSAVDALVRSLDPKFEDDGTTRGSAATALGQIGDPKAVEHLKRFQETETCIGAYLSMAGALQRIADASHRTAESTRRLQRTWERLRNDFLRLAEAPSQPIFEYHLESVLDTFEQQYGKVGQMSEDDCRTHLAALLKRTPGLWVVEEGWPATGDRLDVGLFTSGGRAVVLELKLRKDKKPDTAKNLTQLRRYLADLESEGLGSPEGHLIYFDERPDPSDWSPHDRSRDVEGLRVWWVSLNRASASKLKAVKP